MRNVSTHATLTQAAAKVQAVYRGRKARLDYAESVDNPQLVPGS